MLPIFLQTLPFFAVIGIGFAAARAGLFPPEATAWLTRFVFFFALSAMLGRLTATLSLERIWDPAFVAAYLLATGGLFLAQLVLARMRGAPLANAAIEAQCCTIGNTGFLGLPMLSMLLGPGASGPLVLVLVLDMIVFSSLVTLLITAARGGRLGVRFLFGLAKGLIGNPMIMSMAAGFAWAATGRALPQAVDQTLVLLGSAATPCALFAIGASLTGRQTGRQSGRGGASGHALQAIWITLSKLLLHPALVALMALVVFALPAPAAIAMIAASALPVAGNIYILAQHYGVAPQRVSAAILFSTAASLMTIPLVIAMLTAD